MKKELIIILGFLLIGIIQPVNAQDIFEEGYYRKPIREILDLGVDGSLSPYKVNVSQSFDYIMQIIISLEFQDDTLDYTEFAGTTALTNGTEVYYDGVAIIESLKALSDFVELLYDTRITSDNRSPIGRYLLSRFPFYVFVTPNGLKMKEGHTFWIQINDDLSSYSGNFQVVVEGFKDINYEPEFRRDWLEDMFVFDNPLKFLALPLTMPLILIFTWEATGIIIGLGIAFIELLILRMIWVKVKY